VVDRLRFYEEISIAENKIIAVDVKS